jgi:hypothetical protein
MMSTMALLALVATSEPNVAAPRVAIGAGLVLKVTDRSQAADTLIARAEELGGYFSSRRDDLVVLRVPTAALAKLIAAVEPLGQIVQRTHEARDVTFELDVKRTLLASREGVLTRYFEVLGDAGPSAVVTVERQMTQLIQEIEQLRGALQLLEHNIAYAEVTVSFQFRERQAPGRDGRSSFAWLNTMNLVDLIEEFRHEN